MKIITLTLALLVAVVPALTGPQASAPSQDLVAFDVDLDAGASTAA